MLIISEFFIILTLVIKVHVVLIKTKKKSSTCIAIDVMASLFFVISNY